MPSGFEGEMFDLKIAVLGAGTWGMALARMLYNAGHEVTVWSAIAKEIDELSQNRVHPNLKGMIIPDGIVFVKDMETACREKDIVVFAVPSVFVRSTAAAAKPYIQENQLIVDVAKGIEPHTMLTMSRVIEDELAKEPAGAKVRIVALSGPTHAEEVAQDLPTTIVSASRDLEAAETVRDAFTTSVMRVYTNPDPIGVEMCGALKNVIALAAGISEGLGYGDNAKAALITRGIAEMAKLGKAIGCSERTFYGLAGIGDLIVTATSRHSRNNRAGYLIGSGYTVEKAVAEVGMVVEGINAIPAATELAKRHGVEMPLVFGVDAIVNGGMSPREIVSQLMGREPKSEEVCF